MDIGLTIFICVLIVGTIHGQRKKRIVENVRITSIHVSKEDSGGTNSYSFGILDDSGKTYTINNNGNIFFDSADCEEIQETLNNKDRFDVEFSGTGILSFGFNAINIRPVGGDWIKIKKISPLQYIVMSILTAIFILFTELKNEHVVTFFSKNLMLEKIYGHLIYLSEFVLLRNILFVVVLLYLFLDKFLKKK